MKYDITHKIEIVQCCRCYHVHDKSEMVRVTINPDVDQLQCPKCKCASFWHVCDTEIFNQPDTEQK